MELVVVYDNFVLGEGLSEGWGFSAIIKTENHVILFDTGGDGGKLLKNIFTLEPNIIKSIDIVVLSHAHWDHVGGLYTFLNTYQEETESKKKLKIVVLESFPETLKSMIKSFGFTELIEIGRSPTNICEGVYSTGALGNNIEEEALIITKDSEMVIITGCAHPGVENIAKKAKEIFPEKSIELIIGGFHLLNSSEGKIISVIEELERLEVKRVVPTHCSGENAIKLFKSKFKGETITGGVGLRYKF